jgi:tetrahydromethanopterin S-methyltransferase subunit G
MKGLTLIALFLILLSAQSACGDEELRVENVEVCTIIPLNIEYPLFEYGSCENLTFDGGRIGSVFEFNSTSKNTTIEHLLNDDRVNIEHICDGSIEFTLINHSNYSIFLLSDILVIRHTIRSNEGFNYSEYWSEKNNDVSGVVKENFFDYSPILPCLDGVCPLDKNEYILKTFTVIIIANPDSTEPRINDTNLESYARFLLHAPDESIKIERTGAGKFIAYHQGKEVALIQNHLVHPYHVWYFLPFIELTEIIIPISEEQIKTIESGIDNSSDTVRQSLDNLTQITLWDSLLASLSLSNKIDVMYSEIPGNSPAKDYETDIDILTDLKKKEQEVLLNSNMNLTTEIFKAFGVDRDINYCKHSLTDDINELNRRIDRLDDQYYITLNYAALQKQIGMTWIGILLAFVVAALSIIVSIIVSIVSIYYNCKQIECVKDAAKQQTEQLDNIRKVLIKFHRIIILHKKK